MKRAAFILFVAMLSARVAAAEDRLVRGNELLRDGRYRDALAQYAAVDPSGPHLGAALFNQGVAHYRLGEFDTAAARFAQSAEQGLVFEGNYNKGNALFRLEKFREAVEAYKAALRVHPGDSAAQHNLCLALMKLREDEKNDTSGSRPPPKNQPDEKKNHGGGGSGGGNQPQPSGGGGMDREMAERILQGLSDADKEAQENVKRVPATVEAPVEKDW